MKYREVQKRAKTVGVKSVGVKKAAMIRSIQAAEGNPSCFGNSNGGCPEKKCCWKEDCLKV